jgi:putative phosphoesterase
MKVAILSDIHANIFALDAVYEDFDSVGIDQILVAGDLVGYYYWPNEVVTRLSEDRRARCIRGNHEDILDLCIADERQCINFSEKYGSGYARCVETMHPTMLSWLTSLPRSLDVTVEGVTFHLSHGALGSTDTYLYPDAAVGVLDDNLSTSDYTVFGHTHYPFICYKDGRVLLNPGSVGQPRDRGGMASYFIVNLDNGVVQPRRVAFDIEPIVNAAKERDPELAYLWKIMKR